MKLSEERFAVVGDEIRNYRRRGLRLLAMSFAIIEIVVVIDRKVRLGW